MTSKADGMTRREVMTLGIGYALAVSPVTAWAISTSTENLEATEIKIPTGVGGKEQMPAYMAVPKKSGTYPVVIVVHEVFGVHEYIKDVCRRFANQGYLAISPYLYFREGDATTIPDVRKLISEIVSKVPQAQVMADLDRTVQWLKDSKKADTGRLGITGFCWGGGVTWLYAAHNPLLKAGVAWYGRLTGEVTPNQTKFPLDVASSLKAPVLGLYGEKDKGIPLDDIEKMRDALKKAKSDSKIIVYEGAEHGFHADYRPSYHKKAANEAWDEMLKWFQSHGVK